MRRREFIGLTTAAALGFARPGRGQTKAGLPVVRRLLALATLVLMLWCAVHALVADASAASLERVDFESASQLRVLGGVLSPGDGIMGDLARSEGGPVSGGRRAARLCRDARHDEAKVG